MSCKLNARCGQASLHVAHGADDALAVRRRDSRRIGKHHGDEIVTRALRICTAIHGPLLVTYLSFDSVPTRSVAHGRGSTPDDKS